jgi:hypothetical protein
MDIDTPPNEMEVDTPNSGKQEIHKKRFEVKKVRFPRVYCIL